jgi:hypothetical protein
MRHIRIMNRCNVPFTNEKINILLKNRSIEKVNDKQLKIF